MIGTPLEIALSTVNSGLALAGFAIAMTGWCFTAMNGVTRWLLALASACLFAPEPVSSAVGLVAGALILWRNRQQAKAGVALPVMRAEAEEDTAPAAAEGWFSRMMGRRMSKELATDGVIGAGPAKVVLQDRDALLRSINEDPAPAPRWLQGQGLVLGWLVVLLVAGLFHYAGTRFLQASAPYTWVALLFGASVLSVAGLVLAGMVSRRRAPAAAPLAGA